MSELERACKALEVKPNELNEFEVDDPFNDNCLEGFVCRRGDHRYGALYISRVNGTPRQQLVYATPKFPYPFDKNGMFRFPRGVRLVEAYEKLDGTNVFAYKYTDWSGDVFVTYKTRLLPVLGESRFGPFLTYWREILERYPGIPGAVRDYPGYGLSFELYGARNKHLLIYDVSLDATLLFGVKRDMGLEPPAALPASAHPCPSPDRVLLRGKEELENYYRAMQAELEAQLTSDEELGGYRGAEGRVWYMAVDGGWAAFKCKPETIEAIHWAAGGIRKQTIQATAYNVLENHDRCTPEFVKELLLEEFNETEIDLAWALVMRVSAAVNEEAETRSKVFALYESLGLDLAADKAGTMRTLSPHFPKNKMKYVYTILAQRVGVAGTKPK